MKRFVSLFLALTLLLAMGAFAFADTPASQNMEVEYTVNANYVVLVPDGGNGLVVDPNTKTGEMDIGIKAGSVIPGNQSIQMSVNAGRNYDDNLKSYRLYNSAGGQLLAYTLSYKGEVKNPNSADGKVILETVDAESANLGFEGKVGVTVGVPKAAGTYTDTLTFSFALIPNT